MKRENKNHKFKRGDKVIYWDRNCRISIPAKVIKRHKGYPREYYIQIEGSAKPFLSATLEKDLTEIKIKIGEKEEKILYPIDYPNEMDEY